MTNFVIANTSKSPIAFTLSKDGKKEDVTLLPGEKREVPRSAGSHVDFKAPVDISFRQKKAISEKFNLITKVVKEVQKEVTGLDLPDLFTLLKVKNVHE